MEEEKTRGEWLETGFNGGATDGGTWSQRRTDLHGDRKTRLQKPYEKARKLRSERRFVPQRTEAGPAR